MDCRCSLQKGPGFQVRVVHAHDVAKHSLSATQGFEYGGPNGFFMHATCKHVVFDDSPHISTAPPPAAVRLSSFAHTSTYVCPHTGQTGLVYATVSVIHEVSCKALNHADHLLSYVLTMCRASTERLTGIAWHPNARPTLHLQQQGEGAASSSGTVALGTGCADGSATLWTESGKLLRKLEGHTDRLGRVAFHPMGLHFVSNRWAFQRVHCSV